MATIAKVKESGIVNISSHDSHSTRWLAFYTIETPRAGYDIPPTEDYWKTFNTEQEAKKWLTDHIGGGS